MMTPRFGAWMLLSASLLLTSACASDGGSSSGSGSSAGIGGIAAGSVEDSLSACMSRIPSDATEGQRQLAEKSCERDQANRK
jgi:hypothetical protein